MNFQMSLGSAAGLQAWPGNATQENQQRAEQLQVAFCDAVDEARLYSPLLQTMQENVCVPFAPSVIAKWCAVAAGGECSAAEAVEVLRVRPTKGLPQSAAALDASKDILLSV